MALIGTLRNKMGKIVVGAIMVTMLSFILADLIGNSTLLGGPSANQDIAEVAGKTVTHAAFQAKVDELSRTFGFNTGRNPNQQETDQIRDQAWNALILAWAYQNQFDELGLVVTATEQVDIVQGDNIIPEIRSFFADPQTGEFSKDHVADFLASLSQAPPQQQASWIAFENSLTPSRLVNKYQNLLSKTRYVTTYEAKEEYESENASASVEYVFVPYLSVSDSAISVTDGELEDYMDEHPEEYEREESRNIEYVVFDLIPSSQDSAVVREEVAGLKEGLVASANDSSYVVVNSDDPHSFLTYQIDDLPAALKDGNEAREIGYVSDPEITNGSYAFYKLSRRDKVSTDSILYRVAKIRKGFFVSDETVNEIYRQADYFAASSGNTEEFRRNAEEQGLTSLKASNIDRNATRIGVIQDARSIVLWLYNDAEKGSVSDVREVDDLYVVASMTDVQEKGVANMESVRNQVTTQVKNQKKGDILVKQLNGMGTHDLSEMASNYGEDARTGTADVQWSSNNIPSVGHAPEAIGLAFALNEEENTRAFKIRDGVVMIQLIAKDLPDEQGNYLASVRQLAQKRQGSRTLIADFPLSYFRIYVGRDIDDAIKEFADIEDMRYKFF